MSSTARKTALAIATIIAPIAMIVALSILAELSSSFAGRGLGAAALYAAALLIGAAVVLVFLGWMSSLRQTERPSISPRGLGVGVMVGLAASVGSGLLYYAVKRPLVANPLWPALRPSRALSNIGPAAIEEAGFRAGVVHVVATAWGQWAGLLAGSIPFGVLHLIGFVFGRPPSLAHVIGVSAGGWLLSLLYLRHGLAAAFGCHWIWNSLAANWTRAFQLPRKSAMVLFEGAWTTDLVLALLCVLLHLLTRKPEQASA